MIADTLSVKSFINSLGETVHYNDSIDEGRSLKVVYNASQFKKAFEVATSLQKKFPNNVVRVYSPVTNVRWGYSVRIWTR